MHSTDTVVIGAGHAGLALSRLLTAAGHEHVVLDRGRVGERWRTERWDSLHLLTPNWMTRLPGWSYAGADPEGFLSAAELVGLLEVYASSFDAPVLGGTTVHRLEPVERGRHRFAVHTDRGSWGCRHVVVATGPHGRPAVPEALRGLGGLGGLGGAVEIVHSSGYRNPSALPDGGVLVVGASSSGVQIADELSRAGREVVLAVGRHTRMPRSYRGMDIFWWLESTGRLARTIDTMPDAERARREPSLQLVGRNGEGRGRDLDLASLQERGVRLTGHVAGAAGALVELRDDLADSVAASESGLHRVLDAVDAYVDRSGLSGEVWPASRPRPVRVPTSSPRLDLRAEGIATVVLATGYRPDNGWLAVPVTRPDGSIRQHRGVTEVPGLYVVGQRFQHRRDSGFIDGARHDAVLVVRHLLTDSGAAAPGLELVSRHERRDAVPGLSGGAGEEPSA